MNDASGSQFAKWMLSLIAGLCLAGVVGLWQMAKEVSMVGGKFEIWQTFAQQRANEVIERLNKIEQRLNELEKKK